MLYKTTRKLLLILDKLMFVFFLLFIFCTMQQQNMYSMKVDLGIPDRGWDSTRPDKSVGWCAEACIQMALEYYGVKISQKEINDAGKPAHSDLYMDDIDEALNNLFVNYKSWNYSNRDLDEFIDWIKEMLNNRYPVICGVKIYPDEKPRWFLDHFVLIVGYSNTGFLINTNMYGQKEISFKRLTSRINGFSFNNKRHRYFARAITGLMRE